MAGGPPHRPAAVHGRGLRAARRRAWFERDADGVECEWGTVRAYDPPNKLVLAWHLQGDWAYLADPARASTVEIVFTPEGPGSTRVTLTHTDLERQQDGAADLAKAFAADDGWTLTLTQFAHALAG